MLLTHIPFFILANPDLATAGQPSEDQLRAVAAEGFEVVINLGLPDPRYCLLDEVGLVQSMGCVYHHIPVDFQAPQLECLRRFAAVMDSAQGRKVFVHCAANKRASCFVAVYGEVRLGWSRQEADAFIDCVWKPDAIWVAFLADAREKLGQRQGAGGVFSC